jgi:hypothetical protein
VPPFEEAMSNRWPPCSRETERGRARARERARKRERVCVRERVCMRERESVCERGEHDAYIEAGRSNGAGGTVMIATGENTFYTEHILCRTYSI